jgi:Tfp pilus assembly protein PilF
MGRIHHNQGRNTQAKDELEKSVAIDDMDIRAWQLLSEVYSSLGDGEGERRAKQRCKEIQDQIGGGR